MIHSSNLRGIIYMVLAGLSFVCCDSFLKLMLVDVPPLQSLALRGVSATIWCSALLVVMGQVREIPKLFEPWTFMRALSEVVAVSAFILALANVPLADITAIYQISPLLILAGASFIWGEKVGLVRWLLIVLGLVGALLVAQPGGEGASPYALLGFVTAIAAAVRDLLSRKAPADVPGFVVAFGVIIAVMVASFINNRIFEGWTPAPLHTWLYSIGSGFFVMLGHFFVFSSFRHASPRAVAPFYYCSTLAAAVFGAVFFGEWLSTLAIAGMILIIACGLGVLAFEQREKRA
ncbi:MAG: DMT family transporter [Phyllobacteriaceae bacterium]|jgi:drug/metabolite transporter (DMT)-like permease|nr:DMT family transporter [Phyllobacteriaceae bacterium]